MPGPSAPTLADHGRLRASSVRERHLRGWQPMKFHELAEECSYDLDGAQRDAPLTLSCLDAGYSDFFDFLAKVALNVWDDEEGIEQEDEGGA
jgi:hypothetical protein